MNAAWDILRPMADDAVMGIVRGRLLQGLKLFPGGQITKAFSREQIKLALILIKIAHPSEFLTNDEKALMDGPTRTSRQKLASKHKANARKRRGDN